MPRRSREQVLAEFHHLYDCFQAALDAGGPIAGFFDVKDGEYASRQRMLDWMDDGKSTASGLVAGVRSALSDITRGLGDLERNRPDDAVQFHALYRGLRGRQLAEDIENARPDASAT